MLELKQLVNRQKHDCNDQLSVFNYYVEAEQKVEATSNQLYLSKTTDAHFTREKSCILFFQIKTKLLLICCYNTDAVN